jgi:hypothetical protein
VPDLTGLPALDVAIGLAFIYFVLSLVCSAVNEGIATVTRLRAAELKRGIRTIVGGAMLEELYENPRIEALCQPIRLPWIPNRDPSYIPARTFALAVMDALDEPAGEAPATMPARAQATMDRLEDDAPLRAMLGDAIEGDREAIDGFRTSMERFFDEVMDRVRGWYKRRVQIILLILALAIAGAANVDTFAIGDQLYRDEGVRAAVVAQAAEPASATDCDDDPETTGLDEAVACADEVAGLGLPFGWTDESTPDSAGEAAFKALGLLITAFALAMGAPFWFDMLGKLARLRGTGNREGTAKVDGRAPSDRDERPVG